MMNKKEKPWDSFVLFAPEKMMEQDTEDYFCYGSDEYITLSKDKLNDKPPEIVKCIVTRREGVPNQIAVYDDQLFAMSKHFPGLLDEVDGLSAFIGILVDEKTRQPGTSRCRLQPRECLRPLWQGRSPLGEVNVPQTA